MRHSKITATCPIDNQILLDKEISLLTMDKTINKKSYVTASSVKLLGKPPPGDKTFGTDPEIHFYDIEDGYAPEKGEEAEVLVIYDSSLAASNQNIFNRHFPYINKFDQKGPVFIGAMLNLIVRLFEHLDITSHMDMAKGLA